MLIKIFCIRIWIDHFFYNLLFGSCLTSSYIKVLGWDNYEFTDKKYNNETFNQLIEFIKYYGYIQVSSKYLKVMSMTYFTYLIITMQLI